MLGSDYFLSFISGRHRELIQVICPDVYWFHGAHTMPDTESGSVNREMTKIDSGSSLMNHRMLLGRGSVPCHTII